MAAIGGCWAAATWVSSGGWAENTWASAAARAATGANPNRVLLARLRKRREEQRKRLGIHYRRGRR